VSCEDREIYWGQDPCDVGQQVKQAAVEARGDGLTAWITDDDGDPVAAIVPAEFAERMLHAANVMLQARQHAETVPVLARTERPRRRRFSWLGPFEGIF
jgi:antitoxin (DNA-binding transcriptional repressor) of toxin-antitoxin stability system